MIAMAVVFASCEEESEPKPTPQDPLIYDAGIVINGVRWATRNVDAPGTFSVRCVAEEFALTTNH